MRLQRANNAANVRPGGGKEGKKTKSINSIPKYLNP